MALLDSLDTEWCHQGKNLKKLSIETLKERNNFHSADLLPASWNNIFLLEAVVEYYANHNDPWAINSAPKKAPITVNLTCPSGYMARREGAWIYLDSTFEFSSIKVGSDTLWLFDPLTEALVFCIAAIDPLKQAIQIEASATQLANLPLQWTKWAINRRPQIVLIDSFGSRLQGTHASLVAPNVLRLNQSIDMLKLNPHFDTIYLNGDHARPSQTYRIIALDLNENTITLDDTPLFKGETSDWRIPAGLTHWLPSIEYDLGPGLHNGRGWDHFHGALFLVYQNNVRAIYPWTSYSSRNFAAESYLLSSIRGNQAYEYISHRALTKPTINYAFSIVDAQNPDRPIDARFYFRPVVMGDEQTRPGEAQPGKTEIMMHVGYTQTGEASVGDGTGSAGCLVSPYLYTLRDHLIDFYQQEQLSLGSTIDEQIQKLHGLNHEESIALWKRTQTGAAPETDQLPFTEWNDKLRGDLWLIRPDERPLQSAVFG